jgi:hypothetical protein
VSWTKSIGLVRYTQSNFYRKGGDGGREGEEKERERRANREEKNLQ